MIEQLIYKYKNFKKQSFLNKTDSYINKYAFVGVGGHSISNLYPVIDYFRVPLKYIVTKSEQNAQKMASRYQNCRATINLDDVLNDNEVKGVFISSLPTAHFNLVKDCLTAGKKVFVEKPPCLSLNELQSLMELDRENNCVVVGFQKRYNKVNSLLKKELKNNKIISYQYNFCTGAYPEGNALFDLFIHPLDLIFHLFGDVQAVDYKKNDGVIMVLLSHETKAIGTVTLSTKHSWKNPTESLEIVTDKGIYKYKDVKNLLFEPASKTILGVPIEKVIKSGVQQEILYTNNGFIPLSEYNSVYENGYASEIEAFLKLVENNDTTKVLSSLKETEKVFSIFEKLSN